MFARKIAQRVNFVDLEAFKEKKVHNNCKSLLKVLEEFRILRNQSNLRTNTH